MKIDMIYEVCDTGDNSKDETDEPRWMVIK